MLSTIAIKLDLSITGKEVKALEVGHSSDRH
jgi:hypothetical protein